MTDRRWETRLLAVIAAVLIVLGLAEVYGASSLVTTSGGTVGARLAVRQAAAALVAGILATVVARLDYHVWQRWAWRLLAAVAFLLLIPLLPFTHPIAPTLNGARRWVSLGVMALQPSELAKFAVVVWAATLAAKKGEQHQRHDAEQPRLPPQLTGMADRPRRGHIASTAARNVAPRSS